MTEVNLRFETSDRELLHSKDYQRVLKIIQDLWNCGVIERGSGYCYAMSDMVGNLLALDGIETKLVECNLIAIGKNPPTLHLVGFDGQSKDSENTEVMNNHVVCVTTNTEYPILIDLSIGHVFPGIPFICERLNEDTPGKLANYDFGNSIWKYDQRDDSKLPRLHQQSMLSRIELDKKNDVKFKQINKILVIIIAITSLNFVRGGADFYQKYINKSNGFGPGQHGLVSP